MRIELGYIFDDDGWVLPTLMIAGKPLDNPIKAMRVARDDDSGLRGAGFDPEEVRREWVDRGEEP